MLSSSMLIGSILDDVDPNVPCSGTACEAASWAAREARAVFIDLSVKGRYRDVILHSHGQTSIDDIKIYSQSTSQGRGTASPIPSNWATDCGGSPGTSDSNVRHDLLFRSGVAQFVSDGNRGHTSAAGCQATWPGTGLATFSVCGAWVVSTAEANSRRRTSGSTDADAMHLVNTGASRGGTPDGRTIKDIAVAGGRVHSAYTETGLPGSARSGYWDFGGSSGATPYMAGFAGVFRSWWLDERKNRLIEDPGILFVNLVV